MSSTLLLLSFLIIGFFSCTQPEPIPVVEEPIYLKDTTPILTKSLSDLQTEVDNSTFIDATQKFFIKNQIKYGIEMKKMQYTTTNHKGDQVTASGIITFPQGVPADKKIYIVNLMHGTLTDPADAPSKVDSDTFLPFIAQMAAGFGIVVILPDYLGYGDDEGSLHPYENTILGKVSTDMISATLEYAEIKNLTLNKKVFLTGYSQGGTVSVTTQKYIEDNNISSFSIHKNIAGAGAYDKIGFLKELVQQDKPLFNLPIYLWTFSVGQVVENVSKDEYDEIFNEPYLSFFKKIDFDFSFGAKQHIGARLANTDTLPIVPNSPLAGIPSNFINPKQLFKSAFIDALINNTNTDNPWIRIARDNSVIDWSPKAPLVLIHGDADDFVFLSNSRNAYARMQENGSTNVTLKIIAGKNHSTAYSDYLTDVITEILSLKPQ